MHDLRYAFRLIRQNWAFSLTVIVILALCIGANTAVLSVVNAAMVRPLPYPDPARLGAVVAFFPHGDNPFDNSVDGVSWELVRDRVPSLDAAVYGGSFGNGVNMGVNGSGAFVHQARVSAGFFRVLGIAPLIGREFNADEDRDGGAPAVILSHACLEEIFQRATTSRRRPRHSAARRTLHHRRRHARRIRIRRQKPICGLLCARRPRGRRRIELRDDRAPASRRDAGNRPSAQLSPADRRSPGARLVRQGFGRQDRHREAARRR